MSFVVDVVFMVYGHWFFFPCGFFSWTVRITDYTVFQIIEGFPHHPWGTPASASFVVAVVFVVYGHCQSRTNIDVFLWIDASMDGWNRWMDPFVTLFGKTPYPSPEAEKRLNISSHFEIFLSIFRYFVEFFNIRLWNFWTSASLRSNQPVLI